MGALATEEQQSTIGVVSKLLFPKRECKLSLENYIKILSIGFALIFLISAIWEFSSPLIKASIKYLKYPKKGVVLYVLPRCNRKASVNCGIVSLLLP